MTFALLGSSLPRLATLDCFQGRDCPRFLLRGPLCSWFYYKALNEPPMDRGKVKTVVHVGHHQNFSCCEADQGVITVVLESFDTVQSVVCTVDDQDPRDVIGGMNDVAIDCPSE